MAEKIYEILEVSLGGDKENDTWSVNNEEWVYCVGLGNKDNRDSRRLLIALVRLNPHSAKIYLFGIKHINAPSCSKLHLLVLKNICMIINKKKNHFKGDISFNRNFSYIFLYIMII